MVLIDLILPLDCGGSLPRRGHIREGRLNGPLLRTAAVEVHTVGGTRNELRRFAKLNVRVRGELHDKWPGRTAVSRRGYATV